MAVQRTFRDYRQAPWVMAGMLTAGRKCRLLQTLGRVMVVITLVLVIRAALEEDAAPEC